MLNRITSESNTDRDGVSAAARTPREQKKRVPHDGRREIWMATFGKKKLSGILVTYCTRGCDETTAENYNQDGTSQATQPLLHFSRQPIA